MRALIYISSLVLLSLGSFAQSTVIYDFESRMDGVATLWTGDSLNFWGFRDLNDITTTEAVLPGPTIYCELGDSVIINMTNPSFEAHTIHLHGLDVDQANDGVPSTSFFIQPTETGTYAFRATQSGNYLYHCHVGTVLHLQMGMYGAVIVRLANNQQEVYPGGPQYDRDFEWLAIEVDKSWHDDYTSIGAFTNFFPDFFHINGKSRQQIRNDSSISIYNATVGEKILLRIMNVGYGINRYTFPASLQAVQHSSDGRALPAPVRSDSLRVYPGERYGVLIEPSQLMNDSIKIEYLSMYRDQFWGEEHIPVVVNNTSGLLSKEENNVNLYPNPAGNNLNIKSPLSGTYIIYDLQGRIFKSGDFKSSRKISLESLNSGMYFIKTQAEGSEPEVHKLIKK